MWIYPVSAHAIHCRLDSTVLPGLYLFAMLTFMFALAFELVLVSMLVFTLMFESLMTPFCLMCSTGMSKPPSKLYSGFKMIMIFARQPLDSLLTASWEPLDSLLTASWQPLKNFRRFLFLKNVVLTLVFWFVDSRKFVLGNKYFSFDSLLTASWQPDSILTARGYSPSASFFFKNMLADSCYSEFVKCLMILNLASLSQEKNWTIELQSCELIHARMHPNRCFPLMVWSAAQLAAAQII